MLTPLRGKVQEQHFFLVATCRAPELGYSSELAFYATAGAAFLDAVRWGTVTSADANTLRAPFHSGISGERPVAINERWPLPQHP